MMNASMHSNIGEFQPGVEKKSKNDASFVEVLAAVIIGGLGMFLSSLGLELNNPIIHWAGIVASISAAGWITMKFIGAFLDVIDRFKKKDK